MKKITGWLQDYWQETVFVLIALLVIVLSLWYRLATLNNGYTSGELQIHHLLLNHAYTFKYLWHNLVYAPYTLGLIIVQFFGGKGLLAIRSIACVIGLITSWMFFYIIWRWYGNLVAFLSTAIFISSLWFLQSSRNGEAIILFSFGATFMILVGMLSRARRWSSPKIILTAIISLSLLYIPGFVWFLVLGTVLQRNFIKTEWKALSQPVKVLLLLLVAAFLTPIVWMSISDYNLPTALLGLPSIYSFHGILSRLTHFPLSLFIYNTQNNFFSLGHMPIINIFSDTMIVLGLYYVAAKIHLNRVKLLIPGVLLSWLLYAIGGAVPIYLVMPFWFCLIASGLSYLLKQWYTVFPFNPIARPIGVSLLCVAVASVCFLQVNQYYIAWSHAPNTIATYSHHH